jgi:hypothetical protein
MEEIDEVTLKHLTVSEFTKSLYDGLTRIFNKTYDILAIVSQPTITGKKEIIVITIPNKVLCASFLLEGIKVNESKKYSVGNDAINMHILLTALTNNINHSNFPFNSAPSDSFLTNIPSEIETVTIKSILTLSPYGNNLLTEDYFLMHLLFGKDTKYFNESFKQFILNNRYSLLPNKGGLVDNLSLRLKTIIPHTSTSSFSSVSSASSARNSVYNDTYILFILFLISQRYIFTDLLVIELDRTQELLLDVVKISASPWKYIHDVIEILSKQKEVDCTNILEYKTSFTKHLLKYVVSYLEEPNTQLLGEIPL